MWLKLPSVSDEAKPNRVSLIVLYCIWDYQFEGAVLADGNSGLVCFGDLDP